MEWYGRPRPDVTLHIESRIISILDRDVKKYSQQIVNLSLSVYPVVNESDN